MIEIWLRAWNKAGLVELLVKRNVKNNETKRGVKVEGSVTNYFKYPGAKRAMTQFL